MPDFYITAINFLLSSKYIQVWRSRFTSRWRYYFHLDEKRNLVHNIHVIVTNNSYFDYDLSPKMAFIAETCC